MCIGIAFSAACCAGTAFCNCICSCCKSVCGVTFKQQIRLAYILMTIIFFLISIFAVYGVREMFQWFAKIFGDFVHCPENAGGGYSCFGISSIYRMSFSLAVFYLFILALLFTRGQCAKSANEGLWFAKIFTLIIVYILVFFIPNTFFTGYLYFSQVVSSIFMVLQSIMLIDIFYLWGQSWVAHFHEGKENWKYILIGTTVVLYSCVITLNILNFIWFKSGMNVAINVINIIAIAVLTTLQLLGLNKYGSIITSGAISLYMTFLNFSAMLSGQFDPNEALISNEAAYFFNISIGMILIIIVLMYMTFTTKQQNSDRVKVGGSEGVGNNLLLDENESDPEDEEQDEEKKAMKAQQVQQIIREELKRHDDEIAQKEKDVSAYQNNQYIIFHTIMFISSVYGCMLISNWADPDFNSSQWDWSEYQTSDSSYWCKVISSWVTALLYMWTIIAPSIFPDRDFS